MIGTTKSCPKTKTKQAIACFNVMGLKSKTQNGTANRIVEAAVQLFSRQGFAASSTHEIARLAGVSEVTVFRHFPRKRDLFWAATESRLGRLRISKELPVGRLERDENPRNRHTSGSSLFTGLRLCIISRKCIRLLYSLSLFELDHGTGYRILRKHLIPLFEPTASRIFVHVTS